jgi:hypothetical protein
MDVPGIIDLNVDAVEVVADAALVMLILMFLAKKLWPMMMMLQSCLRS